MMNLIKALILLVILAVIAVIIYVWVDKASIASRILTKTLGTPVSIEEIDVSLNFSHVSIKKLVIQNPPKSTFKNALSIESIDLKANLFSFFKDKVHITEIALDRPQFTVEMYNVTGSNNNWSTIINKVTNNGHDHTAASEEQKKFVIDQFIVKDLRFSFTNEALFSKPIQLPLIPRLEIKNIGAHQAVTLNEFFNIVGSTLLAEFGKQAGYRAILEGTKQLPMQLLKGINSELGDQVQEILQIPSTNPAKTVENIFKSILPSGDKNK